MLISGLSVSSLLVAATAATAASAVPLVTSFQTTQAAQASSQHYPTARVTATWHHSSTPDQATLNSSQGSPSDEYPSDGKRKELDLDQHREPPNLLYHSTHHHATQNQDNTNNLIAQLEKHEQVLNSTFSMINRLSGSPILEELFFSNKGLDSSSSRSGSSQLGLMSLDHHNSSVSDSDEDRTSTSTSSPLKLAFKTITTLHDFNSSPSVPTTPAESHPSPPSSQIQTPTSTSTTTTTTATPEAVRTTTNTNAGFNGTDPYAFTFEAGYFSLPIVIQIIMCLLYGTLAFTAVTSNMIVCYIVLSNQRMRTATNYFIVNLAVGDILIALLCPFTFLSNLVFQYWPFGLSLCVIVSYSQANSVFLSAYTMVAISIDKYTAIVYPMRLRMAKTQAKIIILVIWSAALLTSLPTALLSGLTPAPDMISSNQVITSVSPSAQTLQTSSSNGSQIAQDSTTSSNSTAVSSSKLDLTTTSTNQQQQQQNNLEQEQEHEHQQKQTKYFCQESWSFWPSGQYYYSMALMVLQFVLPLFVLVITYTRIVIIVWGKKMPGEEDNARDARMARSKRKMIKMVIFCVIAFALTWLPFNALIVIGDVKPDIWEHQNIMYIWFITHYLAMCHTVTNPLIYIWMNNRFRAGFRQVIAELFRPLRQAAAFLCIYCLCLGFLFQCSHQKYARIAHKPRKALSNPLRLLTSTSLTQPSQNNLTGLNIANSSSRSSQPPSKSAKVALTERLVSSSLPLCILNNNNTERSAECLRTEAHSEREQERRVSVLNLGRTRPLCACPKAV